MVQDLLKDPSIVSTMNRTRRKKYGDNLEGQWNAVCVIRRPDIEDSADPDDVMGNVFSAARDVIDFWFNWAAFLVNGDPVKYEGNDYPQYKTSHGKAPITVYGDVWVPYKDDDGNVIEKEDRNGNPQPVGRTFGLTFTNETTLEDAKNQTEWMLELYDDFTNRHSDGEDIDASVRRRSTGFWNPSSGNQDSSNSGQSRKNKKWSGNSGGQHSGGKRKLTKLDTSDELRDTDTGTLVAFKVSKLSTTGKYINVYGYDKTDLGYTASQNSEMYFFKGEDGDEDDLKEAFKKKGFEVKDGEVRSIGDGLYVVAWKNESRAGNLYYNFQGVKSEDEL